ncbi:MAG: GNAT family N-acetyltransferase [Gemmatimonadaceae bacterium]
MNTRIATAADIPQLVELINRAYVAEAAFVRGQRTDRLDLNEKLSTPNMWFVIVETDDESKRIMGSVCIDCNGNRGHIGLLSVDPDFQGKGLGAKLLRAAEMHCRAQMCCPIIELEVVSTRTDLFGFYEHMGYERVGERPFPAPELLIQPANLVVMYKVKSANA